MTFSLDLASTNHLRSAQAIAKGLASKGTDSKSYWIQISGASLFAIPEIKEGRYGEPSDEVYDDVKDSQKILAFIRDNPSRQVDNLIVAQDPSVIRTALIVGPLIYGQGAGPGNQRSVQVPEIARATLKYGQGFRLLNGLNQWSNIHIRDLGDLFLLLAQAAVDGKSHVWNEEGLYLPGPGVMACKLSACIKSDVLTVAQTFGEVCQRVASAAHEQGLLKSPKVEFTIDVDEANKVTSHGAVLWGTNAVFRSGRAQQTLSWKLSAPTLAEVIPETVASEAKTWQAKA
ncbi:uncharacterized protein A1O5_05765 [Cladophialophora psammophila CBS 110553]|uniref:NAD-dependent epimerase/dehydratase domain-containing protein n=1 Tax=Cladophialophora psammophila CBS 110553 TaxID=1182543 RepID=W9X0B3_9EURO|nr:uncharacterized protein A1O5_05765 [Cladophialophora psammophila CBS 110553]EXJ70775.1 hypothetical protein A1O5_05765 [Cladophialophora psammophila CBS 110553]